MNRTALVTAGAAALALAGCASPGDVPTGPDGSPIPAEVLDGVRVEGPVTLLDREGGRCWAVSYDDGTGEVVSPLVVPAGYTEADIVMADPMNPGQDFDGPALMDPDGAPVAFADTGAMLAATYRTSVQGEVADVLRDCGWTGPVLVADEPYGITIDPDGLTGPARVCTTTSDAMPSAAEMPAFLERCEG